MKITPLVFLIAYLQFSGAFMTIKDFFYDSGLLRCYDITVQDPRRISLQNIHGQALPLPNSIETFVSLVEKYESLNPTAQLRDTVQKLLQSFRIDDLDPDIEEKQYRDTASVDMQNIIKRAFFSITGSYRYGFSENDFTDDEKCALHFMLSHTINDTRIDLSDETFENKAKQPLEVGVVSLHSKWNHGFALGRVLLGIYAAYLPSKDVKASSIVQIAKPGSVGDIDSNINVNPVYSVTVGDLISRIIEKEEFKILPNGIWNDISCPTEFKLEDNNGAWVSLSELRGAIDGLIIGKKIQESREIYTNFKLSQILRMYYGYYGLLDNERTRWCQRDRAFSAISDLEDEMVNFNLLLRVSMGGSGVQTPKTRQKINFMLSEIRNNVFKDLDAPECSITDTSPDRRYASPSNIFVIMDYANTAKLKFQTEVIGNLSTDFDVRPRGNLIGVYSNMKPLQQNTLETILINNGTAGCPSCFAKYYTRPSSKEDEAELFKDLNFTLANFEDAYEDLEQKYQDGIKGGSPGKAVLYFNFGSPSNDYRMQNALWEIKRYFRGLTILAIGENVNSLGFLVDNEQTDIFTGSTNAEKTAKDIKERMKKVPAEFAFKACSESSASKEAENRQQAFIPSNKIQYWAMYPQYFLKSYGIKLKFKAQEGASITVCFGRWYNAILNNERNVECKTSNGEEIEFYTSNPCHKRNVFNCDPFYFSVEAKKSPQLYCESLKCSTPKDIQFEFQHEGISCNVASYVTISNMALLVAALLYYLQRH